MLCLLYVDCQQCTTALLLLKLNIGNEGKDGLNYKQDIPLAHQSLLQSLLSVMVITTKARLVVNAANIGQVVERNIHLNKTRFAHY